MLELIKELKDVIKRVGVLLYGKKYYWIHYTGCVISFIGYTAAMFNFIKHPIVAMLICTGIMVFVTIPVIIRVFHHINQIKNDSETGISTSLI